MGASQKPIHLNTLYTSDCVDFMRNLDDAFVDLTVTSPPYDNLRDYKGFSFEFNDIAKHLYRITKPGGILVWVGDRIKNGDRSLTSFKQAIHFQTVGFKVHDVMLYKKKNTPFMRSNAYILTVTNSCLFFLKNEKLSPAVAAKLHTQVEWRISGQVSRPGRLEK